MTFEAMFFFCLMVALNKRMNNVHKCGMKRFVRLWNPVCKMDGLGHFVEFHIRKKETMITEWVMAMKILAASQKRRVADDRKNVEYCM